jgi:hypothetical protein
MLAYYASRPRVAASRQSPNAMLAIIVGHVALVAVVMSAKMELPPRVFDPPIKIDLIHDDDPPPPADIRPEIPAPPRSSTLDRPPPQVPTPPVGAQTVDSNPALPNFDDLVGPRNDPPRTDRRRLSRSGSTPACLPQRPISSRPIRPRSWRARRKLCCG